MDTQPSRTKTLSHDKKQQDAELKIVADAFLELFELLEEYAPMWYTEEIHNRAVAARRTLLKARGASAT